MVAIVGCGARADFRAGPARATARTGPQPDHCRSSTRQFDRSPVADRLRETSIAQATGLFTPTATLAARVAAGQGRVPSSGFSLGKGYLMDEGVTLAQPRMVGNGAVLGEGFILSEGFILNAGFILSEGFTLSESVSDPAGQSDGNLLGKP